MMQSTHPNDGVPMYENARYRPKPDGQLDIIYCYFLPA